MQGIKWINEVVNNFLLAGDKFIPEIRLKQSWFTYSTFGSLTKIKERLQKFKEMRNLQYIIKYLSKWTR